MYGSILFMLCWVHLFSYNQGSYLGYGNYVGPAVDFEGDCRIQCDDKAQLINRTETYQVTYRDFILEQYGDTEEITTSIGELEGYEQELLSQNFTRTWTSHECKMCPKVVDVDNETVDVQFYTMDASCQPTCREELEYFNLVSHARKCVKCTLSSCGSGEYLEGQNCKECKSCVQPIVDHWHFTSHGKILNDSHSCDGQCDDGYFEDIIFNSSSNSIEPVCMPHENVECASNEYKVNGTHETDAYCETCGECEGMNETQACSNFENAVCEPCEPQTLEHGAFYTQNNCTRACLPGYVEDMDKQLCEECSYECPKGKKFPHNRRNCTDCRDCNLTLPSNAEFIQDCEWRCQEGFALDDNECIDLYNLIPSTDSPISTVQCQPGQQLDCYETGFCNCSNCDEQKGILTPPFNAINISWQWLPTRSQCTWECKPSYYHVKINIKTVDCVDWNSLLTRAHLNVINVNNFDEITLERHKTRQHTIPFTELIIFMAIVTSTIIILICTQ